MNTCKTPRKPATRATEPETNGPVACPADKERCRHGGVTLEEATRVRAHQLWERAGKPEGDGVAFWLEAEAELLASG